MKKATLIGIFIALFLVLTYQIIQTSLTSNLFTLMDKWGQDGIDPYPWFSATLWDFYGNFILIACFVIYKENSILKSALWIIFLAALGSPGTAIYVLSKLFGLKSSDGLNELFAPSK